MRWSVFLLVIVFWAAAGADEEVTAVKSKIEAVTVYLNGATVTRGAEVDVRVGSQTIAFEGLPGIVIDDSV
ncbi:MAG: DUF4140 domain-containing protein, partial [Planctomycetota bacterium]|nr:DUF4140 domain-containing protein [Planctomycetota bacterium]